MRINVAYACNDVYIMQTGISLISLFENNKSIEDIVVYFVDMGISEISRKSLEEIIIKYNRKLIIIPFNEWDNDLPINDTGRHIKSVYAKLFFGRINNIEKIVYIDSDTVITDSLSDLWSTDLKEYAVAGVQTISTAQLRKLLNLQVNDLVINDGVVLMDLNIWRREAFELKCLKYIKKWNGNPPVLSEGTINSVCRGYIKRLDIRYNVTSVAKDYSSKECELISDCEYYSQDEINAAMKSPCIIHYASSFHNRPWNNNSTHPYRNEFIRYKEKSIWADEPLGNSKLATKTRIIYCLHKLLPYKVFVWLFKVKRKIKLREE